VAFNKQEKGEKMVKVLTAKKTNMSESEAKTFVEDNMNKLSEKEIEKIIEKDRNELSKLTDGDIMCMWSFVRFLIDKRKNKFFATTDDTIIGKNKVNLEKQYGIRIVFVEAFKGEK
jgi:hypothetical protein